jgi:hypothetical protein
VLAVVAVSAVAFAFSKSGAPTTSASPAASASSAVPASLADIGWVGQSVQADGAAAEPPMSDLVLRTNGNFQAGLDRCTGILGTAAFGRSTAQFDATISDHPCPAAPSSAAETTNPAREALIKSILSGSVDWSLRQGILTITKTGVGTIVYRSGGSNPPSPDGGA